MGAAKTISAGWQGGLANTRAGGTLVMMSNRAGKISGKTKGITDELCRAVRQAEQRGLTRYRLAKLSGVDESQLSKLVRGQRIPRLDTAEKIVRALGGRLVIQLDAGQ